MPSILTVDDSASLRRTLKIALTGQGYSASEAVDGAHVKAQAEGAVATSWLAKTFDPDQRALTR